MTLVFTLMLAALLLLSEYCSILLSCPHTEHCSGLTLPSSLGVRERGFWEVWKPAPDRLLCTQKLPDG